MNEIVELEGVDLAGVEAHREQWDGAAAVIDADGSARCPTLSALPCVTRTSHTLAHCAGDTLASSTPSTTARTNPQARRDAGGARSAHSRQSTRAGWALEHADGVRRIHAVSDLIRVLVERDEPEAAEAMLEHCADPRPCGSVQVVRFLIARAQPRVAQGRLYEALDDLLE